MNDFEFSINPGTYVIAVSGGVDSIVLLDNLVKKPSVKLIVAHFDHGIRHNSKQDRLLVQKAAKFYGLPFVYDEASLGIGTSEEEARKARYKFLNLVKEASGASAVITAHHQDDVMETAIINLLRGTNRKGLSSLKSVDGMLRPMIKIEKSNIYKYAKENKLEWNEDETNKDTNYKRNYVRHKIISRLDANQRRDFIDALNRTADLNHQVDYELDKYVAENSTDNNLKRGAFIALPHKVAVEVMANWLRKNGIRDFDKKVLERLTIGSKTLKPKQRIDINLAYFLEINKDALALKEREC